MRFFQEKFRACWQFISLSTFWGLFAGEYAGSREQVAERGLRMIPTNFYPVITLLKTQLILDNLPLCISPAHTLLHKQYE